MPTREGTSIAHNIAGELSESGLVVVSGLARGVDRAAHRGTLEAGGETTAVLGCGPDVIYPRDCKREYELIAKEGALVSEFLPGSEPQRSFFPMRNRIMSGMSMGVVVVEAMARSGALITANQALEEGREVFAVPGSPLSPLSRGTNGLIKQGAFPVENGKDVLEILEMSCWLNPKRAHAAEQDDVLKLLGGGPKSVDELSRLTGKCTSELLAYLVDMEVQGRVTPLPGMRFSLGN
jgi:DNA processing protein